MKGRKKAAVLQVQEKTGEKVQGKPNNGGAGFGPLVASKALDSDPTVEGETCDRNKELAQGQDEVQISEDCSSPVRARRLSTRSQRGSPKFTDLSPEDPCVIGPRACRDGTLKNGSEYKSSEHLNRLCVQQAVGDGIAAGRVFDDGRMQHGWGIGDPCFRPLKWDAQFQEIAVEGDSRGMVTNMLPSSGGMHMLPTAPLHARHPQSFPRSKETGYQSWSEAIRREGLEGPQSYKHKEDRNFPPLPPTRFGGPSGRVEHHRAWGTRMEDEDRRVSQKVNSEHSGELSTNLEGKKFGFNKVQFEKSKCAHVRLEEDEVSNVIAYMYKHVIIGGFVRQRPPQEVIKRWVEINWAALGCHVVKYQFLLNGYILFFLSEPSMVDKVLGLGQWQIRQMPLLLQRWRESFSPHEPKPTSIPVWVEFPDLPSHLFAFAKQIASGIGTVTGIPKLEEFITKPHPQVMVVVDINEPLVESVHIHIGEGIVEQKVVYRNLPSSCFLCGIFGHLVKDCPRKKKIPPSRPVENQSDGFKAQNRKGKKVLKNSNNLVTIDEESLGNRENLEEFVLPPNGPAKSPQGGQVAGISKSNNRFAELEGLEASSEEDLRDEEEEGSFLGLEKKSLPEDSRKDGVNDPLLKEIDKIDFDMDQDTPVSISPQREIQDTQMGIEEDKKRLHSSVGEASPGRKKGNIKTHLRR